MADPDRARRRPRPRRNRPVSPPAAVLELNGHAAEPAEPAPPPPAVALSETVPLNALPERPASPPASSVKAEAAGPQPVRTPVWVWKGAAPAMPLAVLFEKPLVTTEEAPAAAAAATPEPAAATPVAHRPAVERALLLAIPAAIALGLVIVLSRTLPEPSGAGDQTIWWGVLVASGLVTLVILDLVVRRLLPSALAGAGLPRLGGGLGEMTVVVAVAALLAGAGILRLPASSGTSGTVTAVHTAVAPPAAALAPTAAPPLAIAQAPAAPILPAQKTPVTGGGGADLPVLALDPAMVHPAVTHLAGHGALPLPAPLRAARGGAAADAVALSGMVGVPDGPPVTLGPIAPASATTASSRPRASSEAGAASCGSAGADPCPADQVQSLSSEASSALATVERGAAPECTGATGSSPAPPMAGACTQGIHVEMLSDDPARAVVADGVSSSSLSAGCLTAPVGRVGIADLEIGGLHVAGGPGALLPTSTPEPNTAVTLASGTVVLNEQRPDRGGRGLTVNAVHIVVPASLLSPFSLDMVIGHSHSVATQRSSCAAAPAPAVVAPPAPAVGVTPGAPEGVLPDVVQVRRVLRGLISL